MDISSNAENKNNCGKCFYMKITCKEDANGFCLGPYPHSHPITHLTQTQTILPVSTQPMPSTRHRSHSIFQARTTFSLCATLAVLSMSLVSGADGAKAKSVLNAGVDVRASVVLDAAVFGSSAGQASIKSAPTTWSSRSNVRWNARWATDARYVV